MLEVHAVALSGCTQVTASALSSDVLRVVAPVESLLDSANGFIYPRVSSGWCFMELLHGTASRLAFGVALGELNVV